MTLDEARQVIVDTMWELKLTDTRAAQLEKAIRAVVRDEVETNAFVHEYGDSPTVQSGEIRFRPFSQESYERPG